MGPGGRPGLLAAALLAAAAYFIVGAFYAERGEANADEGFYAYASYAVMHGRVPYHDFAYTQTPLLPYVQGAVFSAVGYGVRQERWLNVLWSALGVGLAVCLWARSGLPAAWSAVLVLAWCLCGALVYFDTIGKTYALSGLLLLGAAACLLPGWAGPTRRLCALSALCALAAGCRLTSALPAAVLWAGFVFLNRGRVSALMAAALPLLAALALLGPFYALDPQNTAFWTWDYHGLSLIPARRLGTLLESVSLAPVPAVLGAAGLFAVLGLARGGAGAADGPRSGPGPWVLASGLIGWAVPVFVSGVHAEYAVPSVPLVIVGFGLVLGGARAAGASLRGAAPLCAVGLLSGLGLLLGPSRIVPGYLDAIDRTAAVIRRESRENDLVLTGMPELVLESGRLPFPRLEMGKFGVTGEMDPATAAARHILTYGELREAVASGLPRIVVLYQKSFWWNFAWSVPGMRLMRSDRYAQFMDDLLRRYEVVDSNAYFIVYRVRGPAPARPRPPRQV